MSSIEILKLIDEAYLSDRAKTLIINKFESSEYEEWKNSIRDKKLLGSQLLSDTTGENLAFTYFQLLNESYDTVCFSDLLYVQKSYLGNFVTMYIKSTCIRMSETEKIIYGPNLICEPFGKYRTYFNENWNFLNSIYPELIYIPFFLLKTVPPNSDSYRIRKGANLYELLFGYEGNVLRWNLNGDQNYRID